MSDERERVPPLFWVNDAGSGLPASVSLAGQRMICFFSLEMTAVEYAERRIGRKPGVDWYTVGSEDPDDLLRVADGASRQGFGGWVLNPPLDAPDEPHARPWSAMRDEVEHKLDVGAAWGAAPRSPSQHPENDTDDREDPAPRRTTSLRKSHRIPKRSRYCGSRRRRWTSCKGHLPRTKRRGGWKTRGATRAASNSRDATAPTH